MAEPETFPVAAQRLREPAARPAEQMAFVPSLEPICPPAATALGTGGSGTVARVDFARYYEQHLTRLIRHLMRQGAGAHEAAEAAQGAFTEAFPQWSDIAFPAAWLRKVAFRLYLRNPISREELTSTPPEQPASGACPLRTVELREEEARVYSALASLPPAQRRVLAWSLDGFTTSEISAELGMTAEAVRQNLSRARARLKDQLGLANGGGQ